MNYNVSPEYQININKKSTTKTLNGYSKIEALELLGDCLDKGLIADSNYWLAELLSSGFFPCLWDFVLDYYFQFVCYYQLNLVDYFYKKHLLFIEIKKLYTGNLINLANNQELRNHFAEIITILCCSDKYKQKFGNSQANTPSRETIKKTDKVIELLVPTLPQNSVVYRNLHSFILNYYDPDFDGNEQCYASIEWFVKDQDHITSKFTDFKVPPTLSHKCMWLVWKFIFKNIQKMKILKRNSLENLIELYIILYKRKNYKTCSCILWFLALKLKNPEQTKQITQTDSRVIRQCAEINYIYQNLQNSHKKIASTEQNTKKTSNNGPSKTKKETKKENERKEFLENPKNANFLKLINDVSLLMPYKQDPDKKVVQDQSDNDSDGESGGENDDDTISIPLNK